METTEYRVQYGDGSWEPDGWTPDRTAVGQRLASVTAALRRYGVTGSQPKLMKRVATTTYSEPEEA